MAYEPEEIAFIIKIGTTIMLALASLVVGTVMYLHSKILKINAQAH